jgi:hypothetical protein
MDWKTYFLFVMNFLQKGLCLGIAKMAELHYSPCVWARHEQRHFRLSPWPWQMSVIIAKDNLTDCL